MSHRVWFVIRIREGTLFASSERKETTMPATTINVSSCIQLVLANLATDDIEAAKVLREKIRHVEQAGETWLTVAEDVLLDSF